MSFANNGNSGTSSSGSGSSSAFAGAGNEAAAGMSKGSSSNSGKGNNLSSLQLPASEGGEDNGELVSEEMVAEVDDAFAMLLSLGIVQSSACDD